MLPQCMVLRLQALPSVNPAYPGGDLLAFVESMRKSRAQQEKSSKLSRNGTATTPAGLAGMRGKYRRTGRHLLAFTELTPAQIKANACKVRSDLK
jgi:hypothetical protein